MILLSFFRRQMAEETEEEDFVYFCNYYDMMIP